MIQPVKGAVANRGTSSSRYRKGWVLLGPTKRPLAGKDVRPPRGGIAAAVVSILRTAPGPLTLNQLGTALSDAQWPLAQGWKTRIRGALREHEGLCRTGPGTYDLFERRISGARLLHTLTDAEVNLGIVLAEPDVDDLLLWRHTRPTGSAYRIDCQDDAGNPVQASLVHLTGPQPAGKMDMYGEGADRVYRILSGLADWMEAAGAQAGDDLCITPEPPDARRFRIGLYRNGLPTGADRARGQTHGDFQDAALAETALAILKTSKSILTPKVLLRRLAGRMDLRSGPPVHLPVFVLGRDPRFAFDGTFYAPRALAEEMGRRAISSPYPRPEDYPADWPHLDPKDELAARLRTLLPLGTVPDAMIQRELDALSPKALELAAQARTVIFNLLQARSRLLNPPAAGRGSRVRGHVVWGPWPGSR